MMVRRTAAGRAIGLIALGIAGPIARAGSLDPVRRPAGPPGAGTIAQRAGWPGMRQRAGRCQGVQSMGAGDLRILLLCGLVGAAGSAAAQGVGSGAAPGSGSGSGAAPMAGSTSPSSGGGLGGAAGPGDRGGVGGGPAPSGGTGALYGGEGPPKRTAPDAPAGAAAPDGAGDLGAPTSAPAGPDGVGPRAADREGDRHPNGSAFGVPR